MIKKIVWIVNVILIGVLIFLIYNHSISVETSKEEKEIKNYSTWIWDTSIIYDDVKLSNLKKNNVNLVYYYFDIREELTYNIDAIKVLIDNNYEVEVLFGDPNYVLPEEISVLNSIHEYLNEYNESVAEKYKIDTIHVDVEPYVLDGWNKNRSSIVKNFQDYIIELHNVFEDYIINFDVTFWYDTIEYNNSYGSGNLYDFIIEYVDGVTIMAYNDDADFIIENVEYEIQNFDTVEIAVEYGNISEVNTTFYDEGLDFMYEEIHKVYLKYNNVNYAIHSLVE